MKPIGQTIQYWRTYKRITQGELARLSGVSRPNLSAIEQGGRDLTLGTLRRIASALSVSPGALIDGVGPKPVYAPISTNRHSIDRVARLAAGEQLRATPKERKVAAALSFIMKSKTGWKGIKKVRRRTARSENETLSQLKTEMGTELFNHLLHRVEKNLAAYE